MSEGFDPYLQWLGIRDPGRPPNHYRLLGVDPFEDDPDVLANAADRQMAHVRTFQTGKHSTESQTLLNELAAAKICLLNEEKKAEYDAGLRAKQAAEAKLSVMPPPVQPPKPPPVEPPEPPPVKSPFDIPPVTFPPPSIVTDEPPPSIVTDEPPVNKPPSGVVTIAPPPSNIANESPTGTVMDGPPPISTVPPQIVRGAADGAACEAAQATRAAKRSSPAVFTAAVMLGMLILILLLAGLVVIFSPGDAAKKEPPGKVGATNGSRPKHDPEPKPKPATDPRNLPPTAESISAARSAMRSGDLPAAARWLRWAGKKATDARQRSQIAQLRTVLDYLEGFAMALNQALETLQPGDRLTVGNSRATVIKVNGDELVLQVDGQHRPYTRGTLPSQLALAIAKPRLPDALESSLLCKAAVLIFDPSGDWELAGELCREAQSRGLPTDELLAELKLVLESVRKAPKPEPPKPDPPKPDPPKPRPPSPPKQTRLAVPSAAAQSETLKKIHNLLKEEYAAARDSAKKGELANLLLKVALETTDDPLTRYVLLAEARDQAVAAGDSGLFFRAALQMGKEYQLDWQTTTVQTLHKLAKRTRTPQANQAMAKIALVLAVMSGRKNDFDTAASAAEAARDMARKARDSALIKKAVSMMKDVDGWRQLHEDFLKVEKALAARSGDREANLIGGKYHCFVKGAWYRGLPMLRAGSDTVLAAAAEAERHRPREATQMAAVGDRWYEAARQGDRLTRRFVQTRAVYWYRRALLDRKLTGLTRVRVEQRLEELGGG